MWQMVGAGTKAGAWAEIFDTLEPEPEPHQNGPAPQHRSQKATELRNISLKVTIISVGWHKIRN
jgi:hypothetical protein